MLRTPAQFKRSLRDGRVVYFKGKRVEDVTTHPDLGVGVAHVALDFELAESSEHRDLFTYETENGERASRYFKPPQNIDDLLKRNAMIETSTQLGGGVVQLIKEIGTDCLFALFHVAAEVDKRAGTNYSERVQNFYRHCRDNDCAMAVAQTDVKGDRARPPSEQAHPDYYVRVVERRDDGIVVRGAKAHTTATPYVNELFVIPTRALGENDKDYAVAFATPVNANGLRMIASPFGATSHSAFHNPVSSRHHMTETLTIFDDVFVPWERVFLCGEWQAAGLLALTFVEYHRFTAISYKPPMLDLLIGASALMAEFNGIVRASHVREKMFHLVNYVETIRALTKAAAYECKPRAANLVVPDPVITNICKYDFASHYHQMIQYVQDIAGGLLVTGPSEEDVNHPDTRGDIEKFFGGAGGVDGITRLKLFNLIRDIAASDFGGYHEVLAIHAEGSLEAQKITITRGFDVERCKRLAKEIAGIE
jgi:aromatic ring hydroxylase